MKYLWRRHDDTRVRLWRAGDPGDWFEVLSLRNFQSRAADLQADGHEVVAVPEDEDEGSQ